MSHHSGGCGLKFVGQLGKFRGLRRYFIHHFQLNKSYIFTNWIWYKTQIKTDLSVAPHSLGMTYDLIMIQHNNFGAPKILILPHLKIWNFLLLLLHIIHKMTLPNLHLAQCATRIILWITQIRKVYLSVCLFEEQGLAPSLEMSQIWKSEELTKHWSLKILQIVNKKRKYFFCIQKIP